MAEILLEGLSVEELEALRDRVGTALTAALVGQLKFGGFESFDFSPCDDRSMGHLKFTAKTEHGVLSYEAWLGNGYTDDVTVLLDGEKAKGVSDCLDVPCFHDNSTEDEAKQESVKAVLEWVVAYEEYLTD